MSELASIAGPRVYLDANIFVYAIEGHPKYRELLTAVFERFQLGEWQPITSPVTLAEVLVKPLRAEKRHLVRAYHRHICSSAYLQLAEVTISVLFEAARLRAATDATLYDAIHVATARTVHCQSLLTNDKKMSLLCSDISVVLDKIL